MSKHSSQIIENSKETGGKRTVIRSLFHAGAAVQSHFHTKFKETFRVIEGEMSLEIDGKRIMLIAGESITVQKKAIHSFSILNLSLVEITLEPASPSFEQSIEIIKGTAEDDLLQPGIMDDMNLILMAITADLTNSKYMGETGTMLKYFTKKKSAMIKECKAQWLEKYCNK